MDCIMLCDEDFAVINHFEPKQFCRTQMVLQPHR